jgi:hypothetical protein
MLESVTVLADIEHGSEKHTIALEQERAGYYATIVIDELAFRSAIESDDGSIPDDDEEMIRRLHVHGYMTGSTARELLGLARRHEVDTLRQALALAKALEKDKENNDFD